MTPRLFDAIRKRHVKHLGREELLVGILASHVANYSMTRGKHAKTLRAQDYVFSDVSAVKAAVQPKPQTVEQQWAVFDRFCRNFRLAAKAKGN